MSAVNAIAAQRARASGGSSTPAKRRALAIALLVLAVVLVIAAIAVPAWWLYKRYADSAAMASRQLASYTALNQLRPSLLQGVETLKAKETRKYFVKGNTPALMSADLQDTIRTLVENNGGRIVVSQLLPHRDEGGYRVLNASVQVTANIQNLRRILYEMEARTPYLFVENLNIRSQVQPPPLFKPTPGFEPDMFIQFDVSGIAPANGVVENKDAGEAPKSNAPPAAAVPGGKA
jgi:general secretion pathway protein M